MPSLSSPYIEYHYTMPSESDPLVVQPLKLPKSVLDAFRAVAAIEGRDITWLLRNELTGSAKRFTEKLAAEKLAKQKAKVKR